MSDYNQLLTRLKEVEKTLLNLGKIKKRKCTACHIERFPSEFHSHMLSDSVKKPVCKICASRRRERARNSIEI